MDIFIFYFNPHLRICFIDFLRVRKGEREREKHQSVASCNLGMCPNQESKLCLLVYGMALRPTEPPGQGWMNISESNSSISAEDGVEGRKKIWVILEVIER